jgi:hypothetical protein
MKTAQGCRTILQNHLHIFEATLERTLATLDFSLLLNLIFIVLLFAMFSAGTSQ